ncbi:hypothetical protein AGABI1DRAFT_110882 [Agaricus bisporus var. burnettii JB137-S8]|uniref:Uncharacterized protein n=1 Tax=Agaricus bisporus var. burnettii (strain JB137-S8 / ATCC MYA-4627 / FGSC 10392) TaxID=597362 RepID=K5XLP4_AGABU|nr:uncharacterized protein AGABI1DRAFT_110882 [Agaricus bisporus var. burnettii JB137-S8]EKM84347.1 hypothetical protein AGABI1DRAFT_110882 [Agaricus bisporus var. burnettii JB137-S8]
MFIQVKYIFVKRVEFDGLEEELLEGPPPTADIGCLVGTDCALGNGKAEDLVQ